jgi:hypothetical protein
MRRGALTVVAVAGLLAGGCRAVSVPPPSPPVLPKPVVLSVTSPVALVRFDPVTGARRIRVYVVSISNPAGQAITLGVSISDGGDAPVEVGTVSPFPVDHPGELTLAMSDAASRVAGGAKPQLVIVLSAAGKEPVRDDVRVEVTAQVS